MPALEEVLDALLGMARRSPRGQAYVDAALRSAKMTLSAAQRESMLRALLRLGEIEDVVPLDDGGTLVTVTRAATPELKRADGRSCNRTARPVSGGGLRADGEGSQVGQHGHRPVQREGQ